VEEDDAQEKDVSKDMNTSKVEEDVPDTADS